MGFLDPVARAEREHAANEARVEDFKAKIEALKANQHGTEEFDTLDHIDEQIATLRRKLTLAEGVAANSAERLEAARAEAAEKDADAKHAAEEKQTKADTALVAKAAKAGEALIAALEALESSNARTAAYNAQRGSRPFILDAETRVRQIPAKTRPAVYDERVVWEKGDGSRPFRYRQDSSGEMVPAEAGFTRKVVNECVRPERQIPATMPDRYSELLPILKRALEQ